MTDCYRRLQCVQEILLTGWCGTAFLIWLGLALWIGYLRWWVEIDMTQARFLWAYWPLDVAAFVALVGWYVPLKILVDR